VVIDRWQRLFSLPMIVQRYLSKEPITKAERDTVSELLKKWRIRLHNISWFMRCINEPIARQANIEDKCTGRYWEGRYKSQALLDEKALAVCMAYVDLNPIRAGMAETPEQSDYTSIQARSQKLKENPERASEISAPEGLLPFVGYPRQATPKGLPFRLKDYLELVDWTGRAILEEKRGFLSGNQPPILERLQIDSENWLYMTQHFESRFKGLVGASHVLKVACQKLKFRRTPNLSAVSELLN
jgi:hypothetical protein